MALGVNTAHELSHRPNKKDHYLSHATLMPLFYNHFRVEHPYGHHKRAATPEDPASSKMGETFYEFWPRTVFGGLKSAVEIEKNRLKTQRFIIFQSGKRTVSRLGDECSFSCHHVEAVW